MKKITLLLISFFIFFNCFSDEIKIIENSIGQLNEKTINYLIINNLILKEISKTGSISSETANNILKKLEDINPSLFPKLPTSNVIKITDRDIIAENNTCPTDSDNTFNTYSADELQVSPINFETPVGLVTGSEMGTYYQFGRDIAKISQKYGVNVTPKVSRGSIDNIKRMSSLENVLFAIVQSDILAYLSKSGNPKFRNYAKRLRLIYPFYNEEVHLFARKNIDTIDDLNGRRVVVGPRNSGTNITAQNILKIMNVQPSEYIHTSIDAGIKKVLLGTADAVFVVAGKPRKGFVNLSASPKASIKKLLQKVHFVPLNDKALLADYVGSNLSQQDYHFINGAIPTVAVKALLVSFDFSSGKSKNYKKYCQQLSLIGQAIRENINILKTSQYHKKWKQVNLKTGMKKWLMDRCSHSVKNIK